MLKYTKFFLLGLCFWLEKDIIDCHSNYFFFFYNSCNYSCNYNYNYNNNYNHNTITGAGPKRDKCTDKFDIFHRSILHNRAYDNIVKPKRLVRWIQHFQFQLLSLSRMETLPSYITHHPGPLACYQPDRITDSFTPWRTVDSCVEDNLPILAVCSGAQSPAPGRSISP